MNRLITGILLGFVIAVSVFAVARAVDRQRVQSTAGWNDTATVAPPRATPKGTGLPPSDSSPDTKHDSASFFDPVDTTKQKPTGDEKVTGSKPATDPPPTSSKDRTTQFDQELELLRRLGIDAYRKRIVSMLQATPNDGAPPENSEQPTPKDRSAAPPTPTKPDPIESLHDDSSALSPDHRLIDQLILEEAPKFGIDPRLLHAMCAVESGFNPRAVSPRQAKGAFQLIDATADRFQVKNPFNPRENLLGALRYIRFLADLYGRRRLDLVLAAYNCGEQCVDRFGGRVPPIPETQVYVKNVLKLYRQSA